MSEPEIRVISYRDHHHTHTASEAQLEVHTDTTSKFGQNAFIFVLIHYLWWNVAMGVGLYVLWRLGWWGRIVATLLVLSYLPSFFDMCQVKTGRPWDSFRTHPVWDYALNYGQYEIVRTAKLDSSKQYLFGLYPHGILVLSRVGMYGGVFEKLFPGIKFRVLGASPMFWIPGSREICLWMGAVDAAAKTAKYCLNKGLSLFVYPGGSKEIFSTNGESPETVLVLRTGFVRLAIQQGCSIVPTFIFGEKWCYKRLFLPRPIMSFFMNTLRVPLILFWGKWFTWMPLADRNRPLTIVFGRPIPVTQNDNPSDEVVKQVHAEYMKELTGLYEKYKGKVGYGENEVLKCVDPYEKKSKKDN